MTSPDQPRLKGAGVIDHSSGRLKRAASMFKEIGPGGILKRVVSAGPRGTYDFIARNLRHQIAHSMAIQFDRRWSVDTAGSIQLDTLDVVGPNRGGGNEAVSTSPMSMNWLLDQVPLSAPSTFIDIGCGKGRTMLLASERFPAAIGVEFARELAETARCNSQAYRQRSPSAGDIKVVFRDATEFEFPPGPLVVYFYNPFSEPIFRKVLDNIVSSLTADPRPCTIIYATGMGTLGWAATALRDANGFTEVKRGRTPRFLDAIRRLDYIIFEWR